MKHEARLVCIAAALALAATSTTALAVKPVSKDRQAAVAKISNNHRNFRQPKSMAEAATTEVVLSDGTAQVAVPEELWNEISVQTDAQGNVQAHEADATGVAVVKEADAHE
jgi:hypothetical protein